MSGWNEDPMFEAFVADVREHLIPKMEASTCIVSLVTGKVDVKFAVETGLALLLDKPIIIAVVGDTPVPAKLRAVADAVVEYDPADPMGTSQRIMAAMDQIVMPDDDE